MAPVNSQPVFPPTTKARYAMPTTGLIGLIKDSFTLPTLLVLGGLGQTVFSFILPARYALLPLAFLLLRTLVLTALELASPARYASKLGVIPGRTSAQLPDASYNSLVSGNASPFGSSLSEEGLVVFHIGIRANHPLGLLSPGGKEFAARSAAVYAGLLERAEEFGCLGGTAWRGDQTASHNTTLGVFYFRDLEGLNRFAHAPVHRQIWDWYNKVFVKEWGYTHIGIYHEAFCVPAGAYESIYIDMPPTLMGAGRASVRNDATGVDESVRTLVDASRPIWRSQHSRLGR